MIKRALGLLLPGIIVFLDVDDLEEIDLIEEYVEASQCMLLMGTCQTTLELHRLAVPHTGLLLTRLSLALASL